MRSTYEDFMGRTQWSVKGPLGNILVTRTDKFAQWEVWKSDTTRVVKRTRNLEAALQWAEKLAGLR